MTDRRLYRVKVREQVTRTYIVDAETAHRARMRVLHGERWQGVIVGREADEVHHRRVKAKEARDWAWQKVRVHVPFLQLTLRPK